MNLEHLSYSTLSSFTACPRKVYLEKVKKAEPLPAWFFVIGTSVHEWIQFSFFGDSDATVEDYFHAEVNKCRLIEPDTSLWLRGGSSQEPLIEEAALVRAQQCAEKAIEFIDQIDVWKVEPDITGYLPGCSMKIKAFPDIIGEHKKYGPVILDWKTGSSKPKDNLQLETYNCLMQTNGEGSDSPVQRDGLWAMLKPGAAQARPVKLIETPESMGTKFAEIERRIKANAWPALPQYNCRFCTMLPNCKIGGGVTQRSMYYDNVELDGGIPF